MRQGAARQGKAGRAWPGASAFGASRFCGAAARHVQVTQLLGKAGEAGRGPARSGLAGPSVARPAGHGAARRGKARRGHARHFLGMVGHVLGMARQGWRVSAWRCPVWPCRACRSKVRHGKAGTALLGETRHGQSRSSRGLARLAWRGSAEHDTFVQGMARCVRAGHGRLGRPRPVAALRRHCASRSWFGKARLAGPSRRVA